MGEIEGRIEGRIEGLKRKPAANSTYKKLAVQWLNEVQFFNQTFVQVYSFVLRNRQLLIAAKRYADL
jgi:hypothetical protein